MTRSIVTEARQSNKALDEPAIAENPQPFKIKMQPHPPHFEGALHHEP